MRGDRVWVVLAANVVLWGTVVASCAMPGSRAGTVEIDHLDADLTAALARVDAVEASLAHVETTIGGGADSVTSWIYALITGATVLGGTFYPLIWRPIAIKAGLRRRPDADPASPRTGVARVGT